MTTRRPSEPLYRGPRIAVNTPSMTIHRWQLLRRSAWVVATLAALSGCGGGGGGGSSLPEPVPVTPQPPVTPVADGAYTDAAAYSSQPGGSLAGAEEGAAVTKLRWTAGATPVAYTARAGHLIARRASDNAAQASMFYAAYTADDAPAAQRPVTFFFNGGPGSASLWLHLGSYGPRRLATFVPSTTAPRPFAMVDNAESLLDTTDLVFVDAVGAGLSTAIAPFANRDFWSVGADAALMRDFIRRWLDANQRQASPLFVFGESYGGPRAAVLAPLLLAAGVRLDGVVLQAPALDYTSNCGVVDQPSTSCAGFVPAYAAAAAHLQRATPLPPLLVPFIDEVRTFTQQQYTPAVQRYLATRAVAAELLPTLAGYTGLPAERWRAQFNLGPTTYRGALIDGTLLGRYDARITAPSGSALASDGDPSSTLITPSFSAAIATELRDRLRYGYTASYVLLSNAIQSWDFRHAGRDLPDTVPDLAAALAQAPRLKILAVNGLHDLATPFHQTELDLARLAAPGRVLVRNHAGGHMSYLDDGTRAAQKADIAAFIRAQAAAAATETAQRLAPPAAAPRADSAGDLAEARRRMPQPEPAVQAPLRDPWVPPR